MVKVRLHLSMKWFGDTILKDFTHNAIACVKFPSFKMGSLA